MSKGRLIEAGDMRPATILREFSPQQMEIVRASANASGRKLWITFSLAFLSVAGFITLLIMTRWGIGTSPDSVDYIRSARELLYSQWSTLFHSAEAGDTMLVHRAPFYSFLLATTGLAGLDPLAGARWLNAILFGMNILMVGLIIRRSARHGGWTPVVGSFLMLSSIQILVIHPTALTEPLFLLLGCLGLYLLAGYLEGSKLAYLLAGGVAIGLSFLTRYAGVALVVTGALGVTLFSPKTLYRKAFDAALFVFVSSLPILLWMLRNLGAAGTATNREFLFHPVGRSHIWQAFYTVSGWFLIPSSAPNRVRFATWFLIGLGLAASFMPQLRKRRSRPSQYQIEDGVRTPGAIKLLALFVVVYTGFLAVSISFLDANTPLDDRILSMAYVPGLILALYFLDRMWGSFNYRPALCNLLIAVVLGFSAAHLARGFMLVHDSYNEGWGFSSLAWQQSATVAQIHSLSAEVPIFSNSPEIIYLHTGKAAQPIPKKFFPANQQVNQKFSAQLNDVREKLQNQNGVVVYFSNLGEQRSLPSEEELRMKLSLCVQNQQEDGIILGVSGCPQ